MVGSDFSDMNGYNLKWYLDQINKLREDGLLANLAELQQLRNRASENLHLPLQEYIDWIADLQVAKYEDEILKVFEIAFKAFPCSARLWIIYYRIKSNLPKPQYYELLKKGAAATKYIIPDSFEIWSFLWKEEFGHVDREQKLECMREMLSVPHEYLQDTMNNYVSYAREESSADKKEDQSDLPDGEKSVKIQEDIALGETLFRKSEACLRERAPFEKSLKDSRSIENYAAYIDWELAREQSFDSNRVIALYERAIMDYSHVPEIWDDYLVFLKNGGKNDHVIVSSRKQRKEVVARAVRFCPSSSKLWLFALREKLEDASSEPPALDQHSVSSSAEKISAELVEFKNHILSIPYFDPSVSDNFDRWSDITKCWLSILNQYDDKIEQEKIEDVLDEYIKSWGAEPEARSLMEYIIDLCTARKSFSTALNVWKRLTNYRYMSADFWTCYLNWVFYRTEKPMQLMEKIALGALNRVSLDDPDKIMESWVEKVAIIAPHAVNEVYSKARTAIKILNRKKRKAMEKNEKREIPESDDNEEPLNKKQRIESETLESSILARDREHTSVIIKEMGPNTLEKHIHRFFADCGQIKSIELGSETAIVEFENHSDFLAALTKDYKKLNKTSVRVLPGEKTTIWTTNFPPSYSADDLRKLFEPYGEILGVRLPSLKFNVKRRFAYVQYVSPESAEKAVETFNGKTLTDSSGEYNLVVKISDPSRKQERSDDTEGRELIIKGIDYNVTPAEIENYFGSFGEIETLRIPPSRHDANRAHDGYAFITFADIDAAQMALSAPKNKLGNRAIRISLASNRKHTVSENGMSEKADRNARVVRITGIEDTVNDAVLRKHLEKYGSVNNITLIPIEGAADIEFANVADAGKAALTLDGSLMNGMTLKVVTTSIDRKPRNMFVPRNIRINKKRN